MMLIGCVQFVETIARNKTIFKDISVIFGDCFSEQNGINLMRVIYGDNCSKRDIIVSISMEKIGIRVSLLTRHILHNQPSAVIYTRTYVPKSRETETRTK
jgi:hypothetical protein